MNKVHELKILPQYFNTVQDGSKTFEIRKNDRGFEVGDTLVLKEFKTGENCIDDLEFDVGYTGKEITKEISYILDGGQYGLEEGYCILGLKDTENRTYKEELRIIESGNKQLCEEIKRFIKEKVKLIDSLEYIKQQYETDFTEEELSKLCPRDEAIYNTVIETLKEIDVEE